MNHPERILVILLGAIGDVARGLAIASAIKERWPSTRITWAVETISYSLVEQHPAIDRVIEFKRKEGLSGFRRFVQALREEQYDLTLDLQRHLKSGIISRLSAAPRRIGFDRGNSREGNWLFQTELIAPQERISPKINQFFAFLDALGIPRPERAAFGLEAQATQRVKVAALLKSVESGQRLCAFLIGSTWESRIWPAEYYAKLGALLYERWRIRSVLLGGPMDAVRAGRILESAESEHYFLNLCGKTSLRELPAVFERCLFAIGSDSGPMHIAASCETPIISLWGSTSPLRSGPYGWEHMVLQSALGCVPCYRSQCPGLGTLCMRVLEPEIVLAQTERLIDEVGLLQ